jgi:type IV secretion system protein VirB9
MLKRTAILILTCSCSVGAVLADPAPPAPTVAAATVAPPVSAATTVTATATPTAKSTTQTTLPAPTADPRIKRYVYNENNVYRLDLYLKSVMALQFSDSEEVQSILIGDSASWEVVKLKSGNVVSVKPTVQSATTNMTIYTDKRVYSFELHSLGELAAGLATAGPFRTIFTYPDDKKPKPQTAAATTLGSSPVDSNYLLSGKASFRPLWVQDNGRQTTFFLPNGSRRPAIFKVGPNHTEQLINSRTEGNRVVVDGTNNYWVLRIGDESVCVGRARAARARSGDFGFIKRMEMARVGK